MKVQALILYIALLVAALMVTAEAAKKKWDKVDFSKIEEDWKQGDDEREIETEFDFQRKLANKRINQNSMTQEYVSKCDIPSSV